MTDIVSFGEWVQARRNQLGLSRAGLARQVGCSPVTIKKIERDERRPSVQIAELLATHLQIPTPEQANFVRRARGEFVTGMASPNEMQVKKEDQKISVKHHLPSQPTPFVGREAELASLYALFSDPNNRLITIVGPGGMGKTRLAVAFGERIVRYETPQRDVSTGLDFSNGVFFVPLAPLSDPNQIAQALAQSLDFNLDGSESKRTAEQQVIDFLRKKQALLILDNFEHLLEGVDFVANILQAAPQVQILTTSRERLHLHEEQVYPISGLAFPEWETPEDAAQFTAVRLFLQSAKRVAPNFKLQADDLTYLTRICRFVNGMPLGVELAAGWVDILSLADITAEIQHSLDFLETKSRNMPARHRSIRAVFDTSWQRMSQDEQQIFLQLSIFRGGFTRKAAQEITGASLRTLGRLVSKSLLQYERESNRYQLHELLRQYANRHLEFFLELETQSRDQHSSYYLTLLNTLEEKLKGRDQQHALNEIELEIENVRIAWQRAIKTNNIEKLQSAMFSLGLFFERNGHFKDGANAIQILIESSLNKKHKNRQLIARAFGWASIFQQALEDVPTALTYLDQGLSIMEKLPLENRDSTTVGFLLFTRGKITFAQNPVKAQEDFRESLRLFSRTENLWFMARSLHNLGEIARGFGDYLNANKFLDKSVKLHRSIGNWHGLVKALILLSTSARHNGHHQIALNFAKESLSISEHLKNLPQNALALRNLALCYSFGFGQFTKALEIQKKSVKIVAEIANPLNQSLSFFGLGISFLYTGQFNEAIQILSKGIEEAKKYQQTRAEAMCLLGLGQTLAAMGKHIEGKGLLIQAKQTLANLGLVDMSRAASMSIMLIERHNQETQILAKEVFEFLTEGYQRHSFYDLFNSSIVILALLVKEVTIDDLSLGIPKGLTLALEIMAVINKKYQEPSIYIQTYIKDELEVLTKQLPQEFVSKIKREGGQRGWWELGNYLLEELPRLGWDVGASIASSHHKESFTKNNLPTQFTPFIGREAEFDVLEHLLIANRLLTIVGPGGMGKTRLAVAFGERVVRSETPQRDVSTGLDFAHGVFFVPLAPLGDPDHIVTAMAEAFDLPLEAGGQQRRSAKQQVFDYLREKQMLLILDNFEHLLAGSSLVNELLEVAPKINIIITSRERLNLRREQLYLIQGLEFPNWETPEDAADYTAVKLFLQSAQRIQHDFALVADDLTYLSRICRLVSGMPLAVELAAGWVDMLSLEAIANELQQSLDFLETEVQDVPDRHRSIRAVFDASWQRMNQAEQAIFPQLSVFRGGFTRKEGQAITGATLRTLGRLVSKSLLQYERERDRYQIHELLRQYAAEKLAEDNVQETAVRDQHSAYYCQALYERLDHLKGGRQQEALAEIEADLENGRLAWQWAAQQGQAERLAQAMDSLGYFHEWTGRYQAGDDLFGLASQHQFSQRSPKENLVKANLLAWHAVFCQIVQNEEAAIDLCQQSLALLAEPSMQSADSRFQQAFTFYQLGRIGEDYGRHKNALAKSLALFREINDLWHVANVLELYNAPYAWFGTFDEIERGLKECLSIRQSIGDKRGVCPVLIMFSYLERYRGHFEQALKLADEATSISREIRNQPLEISALYNLGMSYYHLADFSQAVKVFEQSANLSQALGNQEPVFAGHLGIGLSQLSLGDLKATKDQLAYMREIFPELANTSYLQSIVHIVEGSFNEARKSIQTTLKSAEESNDMMSAGSNFALLANVAFSQTQLDESHKLAYQALTISAKMRHFVVTQFTLVSIIVLLAENGNLERAVEIDALVCDRHPAFEHAWFWAEMKRPFYNQILPLPPNVVEAARERGRQLDYWQTVNLLLQELTALGWETAS